MIELSLSILGLGAMIGALWGVWLGATIVDRIKSGKPIQEVPEPVFEPIHEPAPEPMPKDKR